MAEAAHEEGSILRGTHEHTHAYRTELDECIRRVLKHHNAGRVPTIGDMPNIQNVSEESFFNRNLWIPKNIRAHQDDIDVSDADRSMRLEGEVPVTFYRYPWGSGAFEHEAIPLQYLYKDYGRVMAPELFPPIDPPSLSCQGAPDELAEQSLLNEQPLRIMEFPTCYYAMDFLEAFSSQHIWDLRGRGDVLRPGVSFQLALGSDHFTVAISIPYLGVEKSIDSQTRSDQELSEANVPVGLSGATSGGRDGFGLEGLKRLEELTDFRKGQRLSWPRESLTLNQNRYRSLDDDEPQGNSVGEEFILVHHAGIILLNTSDVDHSNNRERLAIFRSCDDKNSGRVPLLPHQKSTYALDAFLNVLSNTLISSERAVLKNLRCKAFNYSLGFQKFAKKPNAPERDENALISTSATLSGELSAVIDVAKSQKRYIKDLKEFLTSLSTPEDPKGSLRLSGVWSEKLKGFPGKLNCLLEERQTFLDEVNEIFSEVKVVEKSFCQLSAVKTSQGMAQRLGEVAAATNGIKSIADDIRSATDGIKSATDGIKSDTDAIKSATEGIKSTTDGIMPVVDGITSASNSISSAIRDFCREIVVEMQRQGKKFRKAWWKRIIPLEEKPPPLRSIHNANPAANH